jgi:hypothetical protein
MRGSQINPTSVESYALVANCSLIDDGWPCWDIAKGGCVMADTKIQYDRIFLRLLQLGPFERRLGGGWRFGTKIISDVIAERLLASGLTEISGIHLRLKRSTNRHESDMATVSELNLQA